MALQDDDCHALSRAIEGYSNPVAWRLYLHSNRITSQGIQPLIKSLCIPSAREGLGGTLVKLHLSDNLLADEGCVCLARAMGAGAFPLLEELDISSCLIADRGVGVLADAVQSAVLPLLSSLWLDANLVGDRGCCALADGLFERPRLGEDGRPVWPLPSLCEVHLAMNQIGREGMEGLMSHLQRTNRMQQNPLLQTFNVRSQVLLTASSSQSLAAGLVSMWSACP
ncbi:MAG: hypothetical protein SGPRY_006332 [Prymnesium sp.]